MNDLFDAIPHPGLRSALNAVEGGDPFAAIWLLMRQPKSGFGHGGGGGKHIIRGFGVEGRGDTASVAAGQWVEGAKAKLSEAV